MARAKHNYQELTDEELCELIRTGEEDAIAFLLNRYKGMVLKKAQSMYILGGDRDDLIQEGMIGLVKTIRDYDSGRDASFYTFADLCVSRQMYSAVQADGRKKHYFLNHAISFESMTETDQGEEGLTLEERLPGTKQQNPEDIVIDQENVRRIEELIQTELSGLEQEVLDLYLTGMTTSRIAAVLGRPEKSTDNALQRVKSKLKKALSNL